MWQHWNMRNISCWVHDVEVSTSCTSCVWAYKVKTWIFHCWTLLYVWIVYAYYQNSFRVAFPNYPVPNKSTVYHLINHFCKTDIRDKQSSCPSILSSETLNEVQQHLMYLLEWWPHNMVLLMWLARNFPQSSFHMQECIRSRVWHILVQLPSIKFH